MHLILTAIYVLEISAQLKIITMMTITNELEHVSQFNKWLTRTKIDISAKTKAYKLAFRQFVFDFFELDSIDIFRYTVPCKTR